HGEYYVLSLYLIVYFKIHRNRRYLHSFPTRRSSDLVSCISRGRHRDQRQGVENLAFHVVAIPFGKFAYRCGIAINAVAVRHRIRSEEHTSELQSLAYIVCRLLLEKKNKN